MRLIPALAIVVALAAAGCQYSASVSGSNAELNQEAEAVYDDLLAGDDAAIVARMSSENDPQLVARQLPMLREMVGHDSAPDPIVLSSIQATDNSGRTYTVEQSYSHPDRIVVTRNEFVRENDAWRLRGIHLNVEMTGSGMGPGPDTAADAG
ncbi:MAG: hypothetical protein J0L52_06325 [Caulobacterales bacterium]|nr:hypothetical protein [Caulobacterales bacterium]